MICTKSSTTKSNWNGLLDNFHMKSHARSDASKCHAARTFLCFFVIEFGLSNLLQSQSCFFVFYCKLFVRAFAHLLLCFWHFELLLTSFVALLGWFNFDLDVSLIFACLHAFAEFQAKLLHGQTFEVASIHFWTIIENLLLLPWIVGFHFFPQTAFNFWHQAAVFM